MQGLIIENIANLYKVKLVQNYNLKCTNEVQNISTTSVVYDATARGKLKKDELTPVVGDIVEISVVSEGDKTAVIEEIHQRTTYIKRPKLANITQIIFVLSSKDPKPDLLMLDKQLAFAEFIGVKCLIVLNKTDLDDEQKFKNIKQIYQSIGYCVIETQAKTKDGIEELKEKLKENINAFSGNSGVGKSTLVNGIFNKDITLEGEISKKNKKGKNTTTTVKLYEIDENTYIADTPGFSTFEISEIESKNLDKYFKEFKNKITECEFIGCTHIKEENCGIKRGIESGKINRERYERFCKIYEELKSKEERKKW